VFSRGIDRGLSLSHSDGYIYSEISFYFPTLLHKLSRSSIFLDQTKSRQHHYQDLSSVKINSLYLSHLYLKLKTLNLIFSHLSSINTPSRWSSSSSSSPAAGYYSNLYYNDPRPNRRCSNSRPSHHSHPPSHDPRSGYHNNAHHGYPEAGYRGYSGGARQRYHDAGGQGYLDEASYGCQEGQTAGYNEDRRVLQEEIRATRRERQRLQQQNEEFERRIRGYGGWRVAGRRGTRWNWRVWRYVQPNILSAIFHCS
jgi:hypothetical protein